MIFFVPIVAQAYHKSDEVATITTYFISVGKADTALLHYSLLLITSQKSRSYFLVKSEEWKVKKWKSLRLSSKGFLWWVFKRELVENSWFITSYLIRRKTACNHFRKKMYVIRNLFRNVINPKKSNIQVLRLDDIPFA